MSFCTNCGITVTENAKFCPSCGTNVLVAKRDNNSLDKQSEDNDIARKKVPTPVRGRANNLFKEKTQDFVTGKAQSFVENKAKEAVLSYTNRKVEATENTSPISEVIKPATTSNNVSKQPVSSTKKLNIWTWIYLAFNLFLMYVGYRSDEVIGVMLFTIVILLFVFLRRNKPKPYNWVVKIILILQAVVLLVFAIEGFEYFSIITLLMVVLFLVNLRLIFKGNK